MECLYYICSGSSSKSARSNSIHASETRSFHFHIQSLFSLYSFSRFFYLLFSTQHKSAIALYSLRLFCKNSLHKPNSTSTLSHRFIFSLIPLTTTTTAYAWAYEEARERSNIEEAEEEDRRGKCWRRRHSTAPTCSCRGAWCRRRYSTRSTTRSRTTARKCTFAATLPAMAPTITTSFLAANT